MGTSLYTTDKKGTAGLINKMIWLALTFLMLTVFIDPKYSVVCGPILAVIFTYLFLTGYDEFVTAVIIVANDALGTIFFGSISFQYLLLLLVFCKLPTVSMSRRRVIFFIIGMIFIAQLYFVGFTSLKMFVVGAIYMLSLSIINFHKSAESAKEFFRGVAFTVVVLAVHAMITGGVEFYENLPGDDEIVRKGILGCGVGDANYSSLLLNIGFICVWCFTEMKSMYKMLSTIPILYALVLTRSMTGFLSLVLILVALILLQNNKVKALLVLILSFLALSIVYTMYMNAPANWHFEELDLFIKRISEKIFQFETGDYSDATTYRSELATDYMRYIFTGQSAWKMLFGGNSLVIESVAIYDYAPHNTYIGTLLQFGLVGGAIFFGVIIRNSYKTIKNSPSALAKTYLVLKLLAIFVAFTLSLYDGGGWALWMCIVFL